MDDLTPMMRDILGYLYHRRHEPPHAPNAIGQAIGAHTTRTQWHGGSVGAGSVIASPLRALEVRGLVRFATRPDGMTGTAYRITADGIAYYIERSRGMVVQ